MSPPSLRRPLVLVALLATGLAGCVHYVPLDDGLPAPGDEVRVRVSPDAGARLAPLVQRNPDVLEGRVAGVVRPGDSIRVSIPLDPFGRAGPDMPRQILALHPSELLAVDRKELSRPRTALAGAAMGVVIYGLFRSVSGERSRQNQGEDDLEIPQVELSIFLRILQGLGGAPAPAGP